MRTAPPDGSRSRRGPARFLAVGLVLAVTAAVPMTLGGSTAFAGTGLVGYTLHATAPGLELVYDSAQIPTPTHPAFTGTLPEATADLETGPNGRGFAAIAWPGALAGNLGTTLQQVNFCAPAALPLVAGQCLPPQPSDALKQALKPTNDPVRAESRAPAGPADASYGTPGALYMTSHATSSLVTADAGVTSFLAPPVITFGGVSSRARALVDEGTASSEAVASVTGIAIGIGLPVPGQAQPTLNPAVPVVAIDSVVSSVRASSDGDTGKAGGSTVVSGLRVMGMPATVDGKGIHVGSTNQSTDPVMQPLLKGAEQALAAFKFKVSYAPQPQVKADASAATATAEGMVLSFVVPDGTADGSSYQITLGRAVAQADASPEVAFDLGSGPLGGSDVAFGDLGSESPSVLPATFDAGAGGETGSAPIGGAGRAVDVAGQPVSVSGRSPAGRALGPGLVLLALAAAALLGLGFKRLSDGVLAEGPATTCPRQGGSS